MEAKQQQSPNPPLSSLHFRDISNLRTPKHSSQNPGFNFHSPCPQFFTTSKGTPRSSSTVSRRHRPSLAPSASAARSKVARRLKAFELEQSKSARKAQIDKEKSLRSFAKSLTVWLNFLLQNPASCGCNVSQMSGEGASTEAELGFASANGKRENCLGSGVGVDTVWRCPKRQRDSSWRGIAKEDSTLFSNSTFLALQSSLQDVCSFEDLKQRMNVYLSLVSCKEIFNVMTQVTKNIDEGRLKMKPHCPIVTDVGLKERALRILMCYNPIWLRIGLYIIFGGDSLFPDGDVNSEQEIAFLKVVMEKQFFSHAGLARVYAYNKLVEGLYRPGYYEMLGNVVLKRFLLLVLILDKAKTQTRLPINYGIDGLDGGSPLLFTLQSNIKSSCQVIHEFLTSDVMHGEGNLLAHLVIVGYNVSFLQSPLSEYEFRVTELFEDLRDGVRLCRAIQLLHHDTSILMKVLLPSDTHKKNMVNCGIALQHLKQAGVPLFDEDESMIVGEDIVSGDKELTLSLLWNIFVHLQLPLLINKTLLLEEISKIRGVNVEYLNNSTLLNMLLNWIQGICESYDFQVDDFASLVDGKAMWCLLDYYFRKELNCSCSLKDHRETSGETSIMSVSDYTDAVHNFLLSQKLATLLGNFPEVLQVSDILEHNGACNSHSVVILLVFLSFQLIVRKNTDQLNFHKLLGFTCQSPERKHLSMERCFVHSKSALNQEGHGNNTEGVRNFKAIMAWWQDMALQNKKFVLQPSIPSQSLSIRRSKSTMQRENAAKIIQSHLRRSVKRSYYLHVKKMVSLLQTMIRAWLVVKKKSTMNKFCTTIVQELSSERWKQSEILGRYITFMIDRHHFVKLKKSVETIQHAIRAWISQRHHSGSIFIQETPTCDVVNATIVVQKRSCEWAERSICFEKVAQLEKFSVACEENEGNDLKIKASSTIQLAWKRFLVHKSISCQHLAATKIQSSYRGWLMRKRFVSKRQAIIKIQSAFRCFRCFQQYKAATRSAIIIQSHIRGWTTQSAYRLTSFVIVIQSHCRGWLIRKKILDQKEAAIKIQSAFRCIKCWKVFHFHRHAATEIQRFVRGQISRRRILGAACLQRTIPMGCILTYGGCFQSLELSTALRLVLKLQRWWRSVLVHKSRTKSTIVIQSYFRGWIARQEATTERHCIIVIQWWWRGVLVQKSRTKSAIIIQSHIRRWIARQEATREKHHIIVIQRWWRGVLMHKFRTMSAILIQSHIRGWLARQKATRERNRVIVIQSYWKGYIARKDSKGQLHDLRLRVQKSAANVDDGMRIINRLVAALHDLLSTRSVSGILHTCATLDMATRHSRKCCEKLVEAGAVDTLLKLIRSVSRSIPDQEVLKHALSTLRNLARYSHLTEVFIGTRESVETIFWELLRNKEEGYFIASELLKKICSNPKGVEAVRSSPALLKRLHNLVEDLTRKASNEKRNARAKLAKEQVERRLREAVELLNLITNG